MPKTRPGRAKKRTLTYAALGLAPVLLAGGLAAGGGQWIEDAGISLRADTPITLQGHGNGHGRGMGQWGAFGYAKQGWNAEKILSHYYGNTTAGKVGNTDVTVSLSEKKSVSVRADAGAKVGGQTVAPGQAVSLSGGNATITQGCGGAVVKTVPAQWVDPINPGPSRPANELLTFCDGGDAYRGSIGTGPDGVLNKVGVDDYVKGVIPKESLPAWADAGGFEALKAQAVAARSYVLAGLAAGRKMDNTQQSQMYHGASGEDPRTNRAADATAGQVRMRNGKPALTEFSASTGGYTAGGDFPAVVDAGDSISPTHSWTATVSPSSIASAFGVGTLKSFEVIEANGLGEGSGRVGKVRVVGTGRTVEATGDEVRQKLQLKSDWFSVQGQKTMPKIVRPPVGPAAPGGGGLLDLLDLSPLTDLLSGQLPDLSAFGLSDMTAVTGQLTPLIQQMIATGTGVLAGKRVALERSDNSNGSTGTVSRDRSDNANGSMGTVSRDRSDNANGSMGTVSEPRSDNSQGSTGTVAKPELVTDGKGIHGLVQVLQNGVIYYSPLTGAHALFGQALTDFLNAGGLKVLGFPTQDALR
ncbi:SpoIID/LytB domain-containing protein [Gordonia sp. PP30]|uniref:SpoIID/LytB domain-containing protein n=1 Tax=unclassified Gordonia (in: high G+C Gram-positive bacteria) TaxID=2657482 RepID=UPI001FFFDA02|nr:SpoIID/LytB domain-containing protein [Gordonia sp. PP30]UQE75200.1 SpoIID/LytB domain-containing protein [Gordonia sp. PP30]